MRERLENVKSRSMRRLHSLRHSVSERVASIRPMTRDRVETMRSEVTRQISSIQQQMRDNPAKWAGIAAGAGFGLGIIGRIIRHRASRRVSPDLVIVEATC